MEESIFTEMIEHDLVVSIPPKKSYDIQVKIESIEKGKPSVIGDIKQELIEAAKEYLLWKQGKLQLSPIDKLLDEI